MKKVQSFFSIMLVVVMSITSLPVNAWANDIEPTTEIEESSNRDDSETNIVNKLNNTENKADAASEEDGVAVSNWEEFVTAYNNQEVSKITLLSDIEQASGKTLTARKDPLVLNGVDYKKLDLRTTRLLVGSPSADRNVLKFENITLSNYTGNDFISVGNGYKWVFHFKNVRTAPSVSAPSDGAGVMRLSQAHSTEFIFEGDIDITTRAEIAEPDSVLIKEGTNYKAHQENKTESLQHSAFWYNTGGAVTASKDRYFIVEDNANVTMTRDNVSLYPPIYESYGKIIVGDNVSWTQRNYQNFISDVGNTLYPREVKFGKRNNIIAENSTQQSINFTGSNNIVEFGPGSSLKIQGQGNVINVTGTNNKVLFRNPVGLDLETTGSAYRVFNISGTSFVEFQYVTLNTWNPNSDVSGPASAEFDKVTNAVFKNAGTSSISGVTSDSEDLVTHFKSVNSKRILTEKIPIGKVAVNYINQFGDIVGENQIIEIADEASYVIDEEVVIPDSLRTNPAIPEGYHYANAEELSAMGKTQPEHAFTGMEGVNDPRITTIYVHSDKTDFTVNYVNTETGKTVGTSTFNEYIGETVNLSEEKFTSSIPEGLQYAKDEDLKEGQTQTSEVKVDKNGIYTVYVTESQDIKDAKNNAKAEIDKAAKDKTDEINNRADISDKAKEEAIAKVEEERTKGHTAVDNSKTIDEVTTSKNTAIDNINKVKPKTPAEELQDAKDKAKEAIDKAAEDKKKEINEDKTISDKAKEDAIAKVEEEQEKGKTAVDESDTIAKVEEEKNTAIDNINKVIPKTPAEELSDAKEAAKKEIDAAADKKKDEINNRTDISEESKKDAVAKVEEERTKGHTAVDNSKTIDEVTTSKDTAIDNINKVKPKTPAEELSDAKNKAKEEIDKAADKKKDEINNRTDISEESKKDAVAKVEEERTKGKTAVDESDTIAKVEEEKNTAIDNINKVKPKTLAEELEDAKNNAKEEIDKAADKKKDEINNRTDISEESKKDAVAKVEEERTKGHTAVDNSKTIDEVTTSKDTAIDNINKVKPKTPAEELQDAKDKAKEAIDKAAEDKKKEINEDKTISDKAKEDAIAKVEEEKDKGKTAVDESDTIAKVEEEKNTAIDNINKVTPKTPAEELSDAKDKAKEAIDKAAEDKKKEINEDKTISDKAKEDAIAKVEKEKEKGKTAVDDSKTIDEVAKEKDTAIDNINKVKPDTQTDTKPTAPSNKKEITLIGGKATLTENVEKQLNNHNVSRLSGKDRYQTSIEVSKEFASSDVVLLASGEKYTDELTATVLASKLKAPVILVGKDKVSTEIMNEIARLKANKIILVGGESSISKNVEKELFKYTVERVSGNDRYETAIEVGNRVRSLSANKAEAILVDGTNFPDAIAMTSMAAEKEIPILLTTPKKLETSTSKIIKKWDLAKITIGGGIASVSENVEKELEGKSERISGKDRYETSVLIAKKTYKTPRSIVVASGEKEFDAIVGAVYAAKKSYPIVLSRGNEIPKEVMEYISN
ncbi:DUF1542 domain-containing protein [Peptostreptococcus faecalis]|uniref:DUF1542 domain-containing protein n=1 Tax=Peptostreptococcus faecalis TaxID=2045015 RepID=UPI000C7AD322|nr:DUF1542 domain-containing protein [Peptostreptococcus faecalis]